MRIIRFSAKGWRARFDDGFDEENVSRVADAFAYMWADANPGARVYVGYDMRFNGLRFAQAVAGVLAGYGMRAVLASEPCPTPALGWSVLDDAEACGAVMITASSASCEYGGISARGADGGPVPDEFYDAAAQIVSAGPVASRGGFAQKDIMGAYMAHLSTLVDRSVIAEAAPELVVDPLYGSGRGYLARLLRELGCKVHEIHGESVPDFGGLHPLPAEPWVDTCEQAVLSFGSWAGLVLDGDGDRLGLVDDRGRYVTPHRMVPIVMEHLVRDRGFSGRIVATYSSSAYVQRQASRLDCPFTAVPMGFSRIYQEFVEGDVLLGAEEFGGVAIPGHLPERDGLLAALLVVECMAQRGRRLSELVDELEAELGAMRYISRDIRLDAASIQAFRNVLPGINPHRVCGMRPVSVGHSDGLVLRFADDSWVQLRPSRTEPLVRACAEAPDARRAEALAGEACAGALACLPARRPACGGRVESPGSRPKGARVGVE